MFYSIFLRDYALPVSIGIHDFERAEPQTILINVGLVLRRGAASESIDSVVDYDFLRLGIQKIVAERHIELQETLCEAILDLCMNNPAIHAVRVSTEKPDVYPDCKGVGCRMARMRDGVPADVLSLIQHV